MFAEPEDGADTVAWITMQPRSTGKVGTFNGSYLGFVQWLLAREQPSGLTVIAPAVITSNTYTSPRYQGGAFCLGLSLW